jgi:XTP/dITP diphosphohydrolase
MKPLLLATTNAGKLREIRQMCAGRGWVWRGLDELPQVATAVEDGASFAENARRKALHYAAATGLCTLADDSGLEVDCLGGEPGVHSAYYAGLPRDEAANNRKLIAALRGVPQERRTARFRCVMVLARPGEVLAETNGTIEGLIVDEPRGSNGFGYDPHFLVPHLGRTAAELLPAEKNAISHRGRALAQMLARLEELLRGCL